jgi:hypothetical protein
MQDLIAALVSHRGHLGKDVVRPWVVDFHAYIMEKFEEKGRDGDRPAQGAMDTDM